MLTTRDHHLVIRVDRDGLSEEVIQSSIVPTVLLNSDVRVVRREEIISSEF